MNILFITPWFPFPLDNGSRIRGYFLLKALTKKHQVHLVSFLDPHNNFNKESFGDLPLKKVEIVERDPFFHNPNKKGVAYFSMKPRDLILFHSSEMASLVINTYKANKYDLVIASTLYSIPYVESINNAALLLEEHNFTTRWMEERFHRKRAIFRKIAGWLTWQKCKQYEKKRYPFFNAVTMVSEQDKNAVELAIPDYKGILEVIPNGVDLNSRTYGLQKPENDTLIFNGSMRYEANADAMRYFLLEIWPLIKKKLPKTRLRITGSIDGVDLSWLPEDPAIEMTGFLDDIRPLVAGSWACIVPLRDGGGTRLKILEAMALGTPVISTTKGAEGIAAEHGKHLLIADEPLSFSQKCVELLTDTRLRSELSIQARSLVENLYDWEQIGTKLNNLVDTLH